VNTSALYGLGLYRTCEDVYIHGR